MNEKNVHVEKVDNGYIVSSHTLGRSYRKCAMGFGDVVELLMQEFELLAVGEELNSIHTTKETILKATHK